MTNIDEKLWNIVIDTIPEKLKFDQLIPCRRCGWCCKTLNPALFNREIENICNFLRINQNVFIKEYVTEESQNNPDGKRLKSPCPFLIDNNCTIYPIKPLSCDLFPFAATMLFIKPCQKGLEMYKILEDYYEKHIENYNNIDVKSVGNTFKGFYTRQFPSIEYKEEYMELEDILKDDNVKPHGITIIPNKKDLKRINKYIKKKGRLNG